jgi:hypothetical protein
MLTFKAYLKGRSSTPVISPPLSGHQSIFDQVIVVRSSTLGSDPTQRQRRSTLFQKLDRNIPNDMLALLDKLDPAKARTRNPSD